MEELKQLGIPLIDLMCVNLYPLEQEIARPGTTKEDIIEKTDVGGPTLLRSAAKGRRIVVSNPNQHAQVLDWLRRGRPDEEAFIDKLATLLAIAILALTDTRLANLYARFRRKQHDSVLRDDEQLQAIGWQQYLLEEK